MFTVETAPIVEPISVTDIEAEVGIGQTERFKRMLLAEISRLQEETDRQFCEATLILTLDKFPACGEIPLWVKPVQSIESIEYYDTANDLQELDEDDYRLSTLTSPATIERPVDTTWPATYDRLDAVRVTFVAGESDQSAVPPAVKQALVERVKMAFYGRCEDESLRQLVTSLKWSGL